MTTFPLQLHGALGHEAADKRIDILRRVGDAGSISEAARSGRAGAAQPASNAPRSHSTAPASTLTTSKRQGG